MAMGAMAAVLSSRLEGPWTVEVALLGAAALCVLEGSGALDGMIVRLQLKLPDDPVEFGDLVGNVVVTSVLLLAVIYWITGFF
jgi:hypothetical protein